MRIPKVKNPTTLANHSEGHYRKTTILEKLFTSAINIFVIAIASIPFVLVEGLSSISLKLIIIALFLLENLIAILFSDYRLPGMFLQNTIWQQRYSTINQLTHAILYTASFATALFWFWVPGDLLLLNLLLLQLPCILATETTVHGLLAGNMVDIKPA